MLSVKLKKTVVNIYLNYIFKEDEDSYQKEVDKLISENCSVNADFRVIIIFQGNVFMHSSLFSMDRQNTDLIGAKSSVGLSLSYLQLNRQDVAQLHHSLVEKAANLLRLKRKFEIDRKRFERLFNTLIGFVKDYGSFSSTFGQLNFTSPYYEAIGEIKKENSSFLDTNSYCPESKEKAKKVLEELKETYQQYYFLKEVVGV